MIVFAVDMDGTFLNSNNEYNREYFKRILTEYKNQFKFIVASSNTTHHLKSFFEDESIYYIGSNGAVIMYQDKFIRTQYVSMSDVKETIALLDRYAITSYVVSTLDVSYVLNNASDLFISRMQRYYSDLTVVDDIQEALITKITIELDDSQRERTSDIITALNLQLQESIAVDSGFNCIDIIHQATNKAVAIQYVLDQMDDKIDCLYTFGDSDNDIEMLQMTTHSYAMDNAKESVKSVANHVCLSNDDDGVLITIESVLKKEL